MSVASAAAVADPSDDRVEWAKQELAGAVARCLEEGLSADEIRAELNMELLFGER